MIISKGQLARGKEVGKDLSLQLKTATIDSAQTRIFF